MNHLPRVNTGKTRGVWLSGDNDGERFSPGVQSPVPPPRRSSLQRVNWVTKHRCVRLVLYLSLHSVFSLLYVYLRCFPSLWIPSMISLLISFRGCFSFVTVLAAICS